MDYLPVFLNLRGRLVLIVGGGEVALRKARLMHEAGARLRVVAPQIAPEFTALTDDLHRRPAQVDDLAPDVDLVVLATDAPEVQATLQAAARARRIWCNRCDEPAASDVVTGSVCDRSPILAGVMSSGCPGLSRLLAARFDAVISPAIVDLARLLVELRPRVKAHFPAPAARAAFWRRWTTEAVIARLEREGLATIRQELEKELANPPDRKDLSMSRNQSPREVMNHPRIAPHKRYTYGDYLHWPEDERWELIDGEAFDMSVAPNLDHQLIAGRLFRFFDEYLAEKPCHVFLAPFDVRIPKGNEPDEQIDTVVQPDVVVICPPSHLDQRGLRGAPDLAIEVLSPSTASKDQIKKRRLYERCGVKEYWVVQPADRVVMVTRRTGPHEGFGRTEFYGDTDRIDVALFPGLTIDLARVFPPAPQPSPAPFAALLSEAREPPPPAARPRRRKK